MSLFRRKPILQLQAEAESVDFHRVLGPANLTALGIGAIIGAGIFVLTGQAAARYAGPAIVSRSSWPASPARSRGSATRSSPR